MGDSNENTYTGVYSGLQYPVRPDTSIDAYLDDMGTKKDAWHRFWDRLTTSDSAYNSWAETKLDAYNNQLKELELQYNSYAADLARRAEAGLNPYWNDYSGSGSSGYGNAPGMQPFEAKKVPNSMDYLSQAIQLFSMVGQLAQQGANVRKTDAEADYLIASQPSRVGAALEDFNSKNLGNTKTLFELYGSEGKGNVIGRSPFAGKYQEVNKDSVFATSKENDVAIQELIKTQKKFDNVVKDLNTNQLSELNKYYSSTLLPSILSGYQASNVSNQATISTAEAQKQISTYAPAVQMAISLLQTILQGYSTLSGRTSVTTKLPNQIITTTGIGK